MDKNLQPSGILRIELDNHFTVKVYNTSSTVCGQVVINPKRDLPFDALDISLVGRTASAVRGALSNLSLEASYSFLKLSMPLGQSSYPMPKIFRAGQRYTVPFHFVIPETLTPDSCLHTTSASAHHAHTHLPPSMGTWERDIFSPKKARVTYAIEAKVTRIDRVKGSEQNILENSKEILVLPTFLDEPPLDIQPSDTMYQLTKTKSLRASLLSTRIGKVTATAFQPAAIMLDGSRQTATNTQVQLNLAFNPSSSKIEFPKITKLSTKIKSITIYGFKGFSGFPNLGDWTRVVVNSNWCCNTISTPHEILEETAWQQGQFQDKKWYDQPPYLDEPSSLYQWNDAKTANVRTLEQELGRCYQSRTRLAVSLPTDENTFLPTFHNCIISRVYVLLLSATLSSGGSTSTLNLRIPLQIGVRSHDLDGKPEYEV